MRITKLDGLRGVFSLMVVFHHFTSELLPLAIYNNFIIRQSWLFVDLFFILSGFVIALNYQTIENIESFVIFIKKRFIRLYPLLFFSVLCFLILKLTGTYFFDGMINTPGTLGDNFSLTFETLLFTNSTPLLGTSPGMNYPSWSISSEMISYTLYGLLLLLLSKKFTTISFIGVIIGSILSLVYINELSLNYTSDFGFLRGFISFFIGVLLFKLHTFNKTTFHHLFEYLSPPIIIGCFYLMSNVLFSENYYFLAPFLLGISIFILIKTNGPIGRLLETEKLQFLGRISYSIYLNHGIVILIFSKIFIRFFDLTINPFSQFILVFVIIISVLIFSNFTYKFIEVKGGRLLKKLLF